MKLGIASIQRNRNPYIVEWLAFHLNVGFNQFFMYCHKTTDGMTETLLRLASRYPITVIKLDMDDYPQLIAYQHACDNYSKHMDWLAFIDGDEFLYSTRHDTIDQTLQLFDQAILSAIGVYWRIYGSSGHLIEPGGLLVENFPRHSPLDFLHNRHVKSIVRCGEATGPSSAHVLETQRGTFDERNRPITYGWMREYEPSYDFFRINHYVSQSLQFFLETKQVMGSSDRQAGYRRPDEWFGLYDRNEEDDGESARLLPALKDRVAEINAYLAESGGSPGAVRRSVVPIVRDYELVRPIPPGEYHFTGNSPALKEIVCHVPRDKAGPVSLLDIGFGQGDLGRIVKGRPETRHWQVDGVEGFGDCCRNGELFAKRYYRHVWHGLALDLPGVILGRYDMLCLFDVLEHLDPASAKQLLKGLLAALGPAGRLVLSTPLWFWPQASQNPGDLEEHKIGVPAASLFLLQPEMFHVHPQYLDGTFVFSRRSLALIDCFIATTDHDFGLAAGLAHLQALGRKADGVLYFCRS